MSTVTATTLENCSFKKIKAFLRNVHSERGTLKYAKSDWACAVNCSVLPCYKSSSQLLKKEFKWFKLLLYYKTLIIFVFAPQTNTGYLWMCWKTFAPETLSSNQVQAHMLKLSGKTKMWNTMHLFSPRQYFLHRPQAQVRAPSPTPILHASAAPALNSCSFPLPLCTKKNQQHERVETSKTKAWKTSISAAELRKIIGRRMFE